ncbi:protein Hook homolog 1 [Drosophila tropicalis]|uniref:protein Hook homolog 1 n=1 Tax=Drosophila tropicalis TaxID=46794 RepID=UPI0035ABC123
MEAFNTKGLYPPNEGYTPPPPPQQQQQEQLQQVMGAGNYFLEPQIRPVVWQSPPETAASMKVFTSVMLSAWRQRRADVRQLQKVVYGLERKSMECKNELHVSTTLMRVEQKRNRELQLQLRQSRLSITEVRSSCASLTTCVLTLTADKMHLQQELDIRQKEHEEMRDVANRTKNNLFDSLMEQRNLHNQLAKEKQNIEHLQSENKQLLDEVMGIRSMNSEYKKLEDNYKLELQQKDEMLNTLQQNLEGRLQEINNKNNELDELRDKEGELTAKIAELLQKIEDLQSSSLCNFISVLTKPPAPISNIIEFIPLEQYRLVWGKFRDYTSNVWCLCCIYFFAKFPKKKAIKH